ncbi:MAG: hypothetical protein ACRDNA_04995 [Gaiellaceae bacterium]
MIEADTAPAVRDVERALRHFERAGFVKEGVRRKAYRRHGEWVDGINYGVVREDLQEERS